MLLHKHKPYTVSHCKASTVLDYFGYFESLNEPQAKLLDK